VTAALAAQDITVPAEAATGRVIAELAAELDRVCARSDALASEDARASRVTARWACLASRLVRQAEHFADVLDNDGERLFARAVANDQADLEALLDRANFGGEDTQPSTPHRFTRPPFPVLTDRVTRAISRLIGGIVVCGVVAGAATGCVSAGRERWRPPWR